MQGALREAATARKASEALRVEVQAQRKATRDERSAEKAGRPQVDQSVVDEAVWENGAARSAEAAAKEAVLVMTTDTTEARGGGRKRRRKIVMSDEQMRLIQRINEFVNE